jgi:hypothetical protein
VDPGAL